MLIQCQYQCFHQILLPFVLLFEGSGIHRIVLSFPKNSIHLHLNKSFPPVSGAELHRLGYRIFEEAREADRDICGAWYWHK